MNFNIITNTIKNKISNLQTADQKRTLKISDIVLIPEFEKMLAMDESVIAVMTDSMKNEGFKPGHELHIWHRDGKYILIDGHIHRHCAMKAGLTSVPCIIHHFETLDEAKKYAIYEQTDRRNLSGEALLQAVANFNFEKGKGNAGGERLEEQRLSQDQRDDDFLDKKRTIKYEYITYTSSLPKDVQSEGLRENHKYDWCIKKAFEQLPYFGSFSFKNPKYGFYIPKYKTVYDRYFSKEMKLEDNLSERVRVQYEPKKSGKSTSGNEFSSGKFYSVASSSRLAVTSFTELKEGFLDYIDEIKINGNLEKILNIEFEHDTPVKGINPNSHCPQLDAYFKIKAGTYFVEVKNHEILDNYKSIELRPSYMSTEPFNRFCLQKDLTEKIKKDKDGNDTKDSFISLKGNLEKNRFLLASDFGCDLKTYHFDFKQFLCHLMGIWSYAEEHTEEEIYFYYLVYRNKLYEESFDKKLYEELEKEINTVFELFKKLFPQIHFGLCYNDRYDTLEELRNIF